MQKEILGQYPAADLRVYAVWFNMLQGDDRSRWPSDALTDSRVREYWDEDQILGRWFAENLPGHCCGPIMWDTYLLFGPEAHWLAIPEPLIDSGGTIIAKRDSLRAEVLKLIGPNPAR